MAGHSKWANIKHRKARADALKGKIFSRLTKEIISSVRLGGPDPKTNPRLRLAIQKARAANLPNENIERNIKKASASDTTDYVEATYELYGHGGVGIYVEALTDNKNRTASDMRVATQKRGGTLATPGSVVHHFERQGIIEVLRSKADEERLFSLATDAGAADFDSNEELFLITTAPQDLFLVKEKLDEAAIPVERAEIVMEPKHDVECDHESAKANLALIEWIEALDDVDAVYHNMRIPDDLV